MQRHSSQVFVSKPTSPLHLLPPVELPHTHASSLFLSTLPSPLQIDFPHHLFYTPSPFCSISTFFPNDSLLQFFLATLSFSKLVPVPHTSTFHSLLIFDQPQVPFSAFLGIRKEPWSFHLDPLFIFLQPPLAAAQADRRQALHVIPEKPCFSSAVKSITEAGLGSRCK